MLLGARRRDAVIARHNCTAPFVSSITRLDGRRVWVKIMKRLDGKKKKNDIRPVEIYDD